MPRATTSFGLIRHAPTGWNEMKLIQGQHDEPLSTAGQVLALAWGKQLKPAAAWQRIICSDLCRAMETAELVNRSLGVPVQLEPGLREQDWGEWAGLTLTGINASFPEELADQVRAGWSFTPPGGESRQDVLGRALAALTGAHNRWPGETILVVSHEGVLKCLIYHLSGRRFLPDEPPLIAPYHLHRLARTGDTLSLVAVNSAAFDPVAQ